jgi:hypothetical protein
MINQIVAMLRGGGGGGGGTNLTPLIDALNLDFSNLNNDKLTTLINVLNNSAQMHSDLQAIVSALSGNSNVIVFQWPNGFDPTAGSGVAVPPGKAAFGWDAETTPGAGDGTLWIYTGPTPRKWAACAFVYNLSQAWGTIINILYAWNNQGGMPAINYFNPSSSPDSNSFDVPVNAQGDTSFKLHINSHISGSTDGPPTGSTNLTLRINGANLPLDDSISGGGMASTHTSGGLGDAVVVLPPPKVIPSYLLTGTYFDMTIECLFPNALVDMRFLRVVCNTNRNTVPPGPIQYDHYEGTIIIPAVTVIESVGLGLVSVGADAATFDHLRTIAAIIVNGY